MESFTASVEEWVRRAKDAEELIFKESCQELVSQLWDLTPKDTRFLASSLLASTQAMPALSVKNPDPKGKFTLDVGQIELVIMGAELGDTIYLGYTANYGAHVHYGANGRPGRPWVSMVAQRWQSIVDAKAAQIKTRLGL